MIMRPLFARSIVVVLLASTLAIAASAEESKKDEGYEPIFNGKNLDGWKIENGGKFSVRDGVIFVDRGTGWLRSEKEYGNFVMKMDFRFLKPKANSGVFVRTAKTSVEDSNGWPNNGYQVQCMDNLTGDKALGSMIPYGAPPYKSKTDLKKLAEVSRPVGKWNTYKITCYGEMLKVELNGTTITTARDIKRLRGHVGIQAEHGLLEYRNIRIKKIHGEK